MSRSRERALPATIGAVGLGLAAVIGFAGGVSTSDGAHLLVYSAAGATVSGGAAALTMRRLSHRSITAQAVVAAMAPILAVAVGVAWAAAEMFLMFHDLVTLGVVLVAAGSVAAIVAVSLGRRVSRVSAEIIDMARRLDDDAPVRRSEPRPAPGELATLARELEITSTRLTDARLRTEAVERSRRELVAWVSHDLRTPLAGIRAMVEAIEDGIVTDRATVGRYHATIRLQTQRLSELVDDLFELSRIEAGSIRLDTELVPLDELAAEAVDACHASSPAVRLVAAPGRVAPSAVLSPPEMLRVLRNLIDNAVRHTPPDGRVTVETGEDDGVAWISVTDSCGGIPAPDLLRLFETGFRGDAARTPGDGRGGLGLSVAKGLVGAHGGTITVVNVAGGCRFVVRLPATAPGPDASVLDDADEPHREPAPRPPPGTPASVGPPGPA